MEQSQNRPRDFFLHLSAFAVLYFLAFALISLLFTLIDYKFPDAITGYYGDPYSGAVRFSIASLVILSPIFLFLMRMIQRETRTMPERAKLGIRKWLTYITLFVAGATVIGDLIALLNAFLGGALPTTFALKAAVLLVVAGLGFGYFFLDLRRYWETNRTNLGYAAYAFIAIVLGSIILGFLVMGSPTTQRELRMDAERVNNLSTIQYQIVDYWQRNSKLPATLADLNDSLGYYGVPTDPETNQPYTYSVTGANTFQLCATFAQSSAIEMNGEYYPELSMVKDASNWKHDAGNHCFTRTIDPALYKPQPTVTI